MDIYFVRHAMAGKKLSNAVRDERRPLDEEGIQQCSSVGRLLAGMDVHPELIVSSPLKRATQTASLVGNELGYEDKIVISPALRPTAGYDAFRDLVRNSSRHEMIVVVGHNPNLSQFLSLLISNGTNDRAVNMKKGAVARVDYSSKKSVLEWLITPKIARTAIASRQRSLADEKVTPIASGRSQSWRQSKVRPKTALK